MSNNRQLERAADGAPSQIPQPKFWPPQLPKSDPWASHRWQNENSVRYVLFLYLWEHTQSSVKIIIEIDFVIEI